MPRLLRFAQFLLENEGRVDFLKKQKHNQAISFRHDAGMAMILHDKMKNHSVLQVELRQMGVKPDEKDSSKVDEWEKEASHHIIDTIAEHDPHPKKKYTEWMVNQYKKKHFLHEDLPRMHEWLGHFDRYKNRLKAAGRSTDINTYGHPAAVESVLSSYVRQNLEVSKGKELEKIKKEGVEVVHDANGLRVEKLKTQEAACALHGHDTRWCTSSRNNNYFHQYSNQGPLYVVHTPDNKKWQFHFESNQFADEADIMHKPEDLVKQYPELKNVKAFKGETKGHIPFLHDKEKEIVFDKWLKKGEKYHATPDIRHYVARHGTTKHHTFLQNDPDAGVQQQVALNVSDKKILRNMSEKSQFQIPRTIAQFRLEREFKEKVPVVSPKLKKGSEMHLKALHNAHQFHGKMFDELRQSSMGPGHTAYYKRDGNWITYTALEDWHQDKRTEADNEFVKHFPKIAKQSEVYPMAISHNLSTFDNNYSRLKLAHDIWHKP